MDTVNSADSDQLRMILCDTVMVVNTAILIYCYYSCTLHAVCIQYKMFIVIMRCLYKSSCDSVDSAS